MSQVLRIRLPKSMEETEAEGSRKSSVASIHGSPPGWDIIPTLSPSPMPPAAAEFNIAPTKLAALPAPGLHELTEIRDLGKLTLSHMHALLSKFKKEVPSPSPASARSRVTVLVTVTVSHSSLT